MAENYFKNKVNHIKPPNMKRFHYLLFLLLFVQTQRSDAGRQDVLCRRIRFQQSETNQALSAFPLRKRFFVNITSRMVETWVKLTIPTDNQKIMGKVDADGGASFNDGYMLESTAPASTRKYGRQGTNPFRKALCRRFRWHPHRGYLQGRRRVPGLSGWRDGTRAGGSRRADRK